MYKGQTVEYNFQDQAANVNASSKLDMRFADDEDAEDIECVLRISEECEYDEKSDLYFRKRPDNDDGKVSVDRETIADECSKANVRWIVMETPVPEEQVVGAARMRISPPSPESGETRTKTVVDILAYYPDDQTRSVRSQLLAQLERIAVGQGAETLVVEVMQHRIDIQDWLEKCGYRELSGRVYGGKDVAKPTMIFDFHKDLRQSRAQSVANTSTSTSTSAAAPGISSEGDKASAPNVFDIDVDLSDLTLLPEDGSEAGVSDTANSSDPMRGLVGDLFAALHKEKSSQS